MNNDVDRISGASYGLSGILKEWMTRIALRNTPNCDTLLINLTTFLRNVVHKDLSDEEIESQLSLDMNAVVFHFDDYVKHLRNLDKPSIIFYIPSYHRVPTFHLRKESPSNARISALLKKIIKKTFPNPQYNFTYGSIRVHVIHVGVRTLPHKELHTKIKELTADCQRKAFRDFWLISHYPIDYHIFEHFSRQSRLLDSHTGNLWERKHFGEKVFNLTTVPFNSVTHLMLGDKILIRCLLNRRDKKRVLELAESERWMTKTKQQILSQVSNFIPKEFLTQLQL